MANRILVYAETINERIAKLPGEKVDSLNESMAITFEEHFAFQNRQASAHAMGKLSLEEAQTIYNALGEGFNQSNGGWTKGTSLALKVTITKLIGELIGVR